MLPSAAVCDLGIFIDIGVAMCLVWCLNVLLCYNSYKAALVFDAVLHLLVVSLVMPWLNYGSVTLAGLPVSQFR